MGCRSEKEDIFVLNREIIHVVSEFDLGVSV
jgi:hypothetical protein